MIPGVEAGNGRKPSIMADAAHAILTQPARTTTGKFFIDEEVLLAAGISDLSAYTIDPAKPLLPDLFLD
jgi:citronellol/citronellal dehydrogenase